jgi:RimJ/RimL family protein N-acetyltransferase
MKTILETKRLQLREALLSDASFVFELMNSPKWIQFIGDRGIKTLQDAEEYIHKSLLDSYSKNGFGLYIMVLKQTNEKLGLCGLINRPGLDHPDIGFALLAKFERKGYTFEAATNTLKFAKEDLKLTKVLAITHSDNIASQNLLEKIGLTKEKEIRLKGFDKDTLLFSIYLK